MASMRILILYISKKNNNNNNNNRQKKKHHKKNTHNIKCITYTCTMYECKAILLP